MLPVGMAWTRVNVSPKISSQRAGWIARVSSSVRSCRSFCSSARQRAPTRLPSHRHAGGAVTVGASASAHAAGGAAGRADFTEALSSLVVGQRAAGEVTEHVLERSALPEARLEIVRGPERLEPPAVHQGDPV